eukprot:TRINITY_DN14639_c0_g1_i1.p1 TRINITY_DN14639_c0_g1~~TRINITY_DN14639_c0_g1_i1.p1  ORF type:complete len:767 (-),score=172.28 TRINITY_DN14639_c0_g1_i1:49-2019(-)
MALDAQFVVALEELESDLLRDCTGARGVVVQLRHIEFCWCEEIVDGVKKLASGEWDASLVETVSMRSTVIFAFFVGALCGRIRSRGARVLYALSTVSASQIAAAHCIAGVTGLLPAPQVLLYTTTVELQTAVAARFKLPHPGSLHRIRGPHIILKEFLRVLEAHICRGQVVGAEDVDEAVASAYQMFANHLGVLPGARLGSSYDSQQLQATVLVARALLVYLLPECFGFTQVDDNGEALLCDAINDEFSLYSTVEDPPAELDRLVEAGFVSAWHALMPGDSGRTFMLSPYPMLLSFLLRKNPINCTLLADCHTFTNTVECFGMLPHKKFVKVCALELCLLESPLRAALAKKLEILYPGVLIKPMVPQSVDVVEDIESATNDSALYLYRCGGVDLVSFARGPRGFVIRVVWRVTTRRRPHRLLAARSDFEAKTYSDEEEGGSDESGSESGRRHMHTIFAFVSLAGSEGPEEKQESNLICLYGQRLFALPAAKLCYGDAPAALKALDDNTLLDMFLPELEGDGDDAAAAAVLPQPPLPNLQLGEVKVDFYEITGSQCPEQREYLDTLRTTEPLKDVCLSFLRRLHHSGFSAAFCVISTSNLSASEAISVHAAQSGCAYTVLPPDRALAVFVPRPTDLLYWYYSQGNAGWADAQFIVAY